MATPDRSPSLLIGQQWSTWTDLISSIEENDDEGENEKPSTSSDSMKLGKRDMGLFGFCPSRDEFSLVVCEKCNLLIKPQALKQHIESRHGPTNISSLGNVPASALNSELGKKLLMPEPLKSTPVTTASVTTSASTHRPSNGSFKAHFGRPPTKASLKQVPASVRNLPAPKQGFSMKINPVKSVKSGNRVASLTSVSSASSGQPVSNPVVKMEKLQERILSTSSDVNDKEQKVEAAPGSSSSSTSSLSTSSISSLAKPEMPVSSSGSFTRLETSKISTLLSGSLKTAVSLTTPSSMTFSSLPTVSTAVSLAITKTSTDTPVVTRSLTTLVSTSAVTKPIMIAPVMTVASAVSQVSHKPIVSSGKSKSGKDKERKFLPCKDREYDANKHCGVVVAETGKQCTRSLTCKTHALSLRRAVIGRCKSFDDLLKEHKAAKDALIKAKAESQNAANEAAQTSNRILVSPSFIPASLAGQKQQTPSGIASIALKDGKLTHLANAIVKPGLQSSLVTSTITTTTSSMKTARGHTNVFQRFSSSAVLPPAITVKEENLTKQDASPRVPSLSSGGESPSTDSKEPIFLPHHPRPLAACTFGGRLNDRSCYLFSRKTDFVRAAFLSALERQLSPPPHKKLCVESNLPREAQPPNLSQDPYEFNQIDTSGGAAVAGLSLASSASKPTIKPKSKLPTSPIAASSAPSPMAFSTISLSSPGTPLSSNPTLSAMPSPSLATISPLSFGQPARIPSRSSKSRDSLSNRSSDPVASSAVISGQPAPNPGKRKRSGSSGAGGSMGISVGSNAAHSAAAMANGPIPSSPSLIGGNSGSGITLNATPVDLNSASQLGLAGIIAPTTLNNHHHHHHQARNLITIPSVNLAAAGTVGAATSKMGGGGVTSSSSSVAVGINAAQKNNNIFKDLNFVLTGLDSSSLVNGQVVNITSAQLAELTGAGQGQTLVLNNFPVNTAPNNNNPLTSTGATAHGQSTAGSGSSSSGVSTVGQPRPSKRHRSSGSRSHQSSAINSGKITAASANSLEGFKIIPTNNVITSGALPPNAVLMDSSSLQGAVLTSVTLAGGGGTPTLVAITSSAGASSSNATVPANPTAGQILCADPCNTQLSHTLLSNGLTQAGHDKTIGVSSSQRSLATAKPFLQQQQQQHNKNNAQPGLALGCNVIQGTPSVASLGVPLTSVTASQQICSSQALFKSGGPFNLTKSVGGKVTVQPVSLTFPINVSQQGLAKTHHPLQHQQHHQQHHQQAQQQQQAHTLLVATSGGGVVDDQAGSAVRKTELHQLHPQISNSSTSNVLS